jgi:putative transcriptional regulator
MASRGIFLAIVTDITKTDVAWQRDLGARLQAHRLNQNFSQAELAAATGIARKTITNIETGHGGTMLTLIALLRGLGLINQLDNFLPAPGPSPIQLVRLAGKQRRRASGRRKPADALEEGAPNPWTWGPNT